MLTTSSDTRSAAQIVAAFEAIFAAHMGDKKISPESVKQEWEKSLGEVARLKQTISDLKNHESALVIRLSAKEQEIQQLQAEVFIPVIAMRRLSSI